MEITGYRIKIGEVEVIVTRTQLIELQAQIQQLIGPMPMPALPQPIKPWPIPYKATDPIHPYWFTQSTDYRRALTPDEIKHLASSRDAKLASSESVAQMESITTSEQVESHLTKMAGPHLDHCKTWGS